MKKYLFLFSCLFFSFSAFSQESYTVKGETLTLKTEVEGTLDLLWTITDQQYRYFVKTEDGNIQELLNTKDGKHYQEEYKTVLSSITGQSAEKVNLTLPSLKSFIDPYNISQNSGYQSQNERIKLASHLGAFIGMTNSPFIDNPENSAVPYFGAELEFFSENTLPRHAGFFSLRHQLDSDAFDYSATQLAIGYRFRFVNQQTFKFYGNLKIATLSYSKFKVSYEDADNPGTFITEDESTYTLEAPFIFGLGADIKLGNGYLTLAYQELFAVFLDGQGNFPMDFAIGYKFSL